MKDHNANLIKQLYDYDRFCYENETLMNEGCYFLFCTKEEFDRLKVEESSKPIALAEYHFQHSKPAFSTESALSLPSSLKPESIVLTSTSSSQSDLTDALPAPALVEEN